METHTKTSRWRHVLKYVSIAESAGSASKRMLRMRKAYPRNLAYRQAFGSTNHRRKNMRWIPKPLLVGVMLLSGAGLAQAAMMATTATDLTV
jgi:hypothetical protein